MTRRSFQFQSAGGTNGNASVVVGGHDLSKVTRAVLVRAAIGQVTQVELDLAIVETQNMDIADADVTVHLRPGVHEALVALGWTPPTPPERE